MDKELDYNTHYYTVNEAQQMLGMSRQGIHYYIKKKWKNDVVMKRLGGVSFWMIPGRCIKELQK